MDQATHRMIDDGLARMTRESVALAGPHLVLIEAARELARAGRRIAENNARENAQRLETHLARELLGPLDRKEGYSEEADGGPPTGENE